MADANLALTTVTASGITVAAIQWLKNSKYFPWITKEKIVLLRFISAFGAVLASVGISYVWSPETHTLVINGLTLGAAFTATWVFIKQCVINEMVWKMTKPVTAPLPPAEVKEVLAPKP